MRNFVISLILVLTFQPATAFELLFPVTVSDRSMVWRIDLPGSSPNGYTWNDLFTNAIADWNANSVLNWQWQLESLPDNCIRDPSDAAYVPNTVRFDTNQGCNFFDYAGFASIYSNFWEFQWNGNAWIPDPNVITRTRQPAILEATIRFLQDENDPIPWTEENFYGTSLHELGHAIGLHHGEIVTSVMGFGDGTNGITHDDMCGAAILLEDYGRCASYIPGATTANAPTHARFMAYASSDSGVDRRETFRPWNEIDVFGTVLFDPGHFESAGAVHVIVQMGDVFFAKHVSGEWLPWNGEPPLPATHEFDELGFADDFVILGRNSAFGGEGVDVSTWTSVEWDQVHAGERPIDGAAITGEKLGLGNGDSLSFWIAYSTADAPGVYHYGSRPLVVTWSTGPD